VGFSSSIVPEKWRFLYSLNPMVGVIDGFRWAIKGTEPLIDWSGFAVSLLLVIFITLTGLWYFRKTERAFADVI
jgi:lipopolysaccharide transport system permease protein